MFSYLSKWEEGTTLEPPKISIFLLGLFLEKLIRDRSEAYNKAHYKIDCENLNKNEIVNKISDIYENK